MNGQLIQIIKKSTSLLLLDDFKMLKQLPLPLQSFTIIMLYF